MVANKQRHFDFADVAVIGSVFPESKGGRRHTAMHSFWALMNTVTERSVSQGHN